MADNYCNAVSWLKVHLPKILPFPVTENEIRNIMAIESERDLIAHFQFLLEYNEPPNFKEFCNNFKAVRFASKQKSNCVQKPAKNKDFKRKDKTEKPSDSTLEEMSILEEKAGKKKKKDKFINLYSPEGDKCDVITLKGRHHCDCQAFKHRLVNNCLSCGRIVCDQEGSGPCLFCGSLVCSKEEQDFINSKTAISKKLYDDLMSIGRPAGWEEAVAHRDRLLEFDRTTQRRTHVIDDEGEYFAANSVWLSASEREKMQQREEAERQKKHASRLQTKFTLDFAGRQITEDSSHYEDSDEEAEQNENILDESYLQTAHPDINIHWKPEYVPCGNDLLAEKKKFGSKDNYPRVQDRELLEMSDSGACLSLHQPWASLLVHGIMRHEGRTWYSSHRGRLWIAAAVKQPTDDEISQTEHFFRQIREEEDVQFPKLYPTGCLLGCVTLVDCLPQEEYQKRFEKTECNSPFVYICEDARALTLKFPLSGRHKIYKLEKQIHLAAQKALLRLNA